MKKLFTTSILLLSTLFSFAGSIPKIFSSCIKMNPDGTETITASMNGLDLNTTTGVNMDIWVHVGPGYAPGDWIMLSCTTPSPMYGSGGTAISEGTYTYTIPAPQSVPLNQCVEVIIGTDPPLAVGEQRKTFKVCPCMTEACHYLSRTLGDHEMLVFLSPAPEPDPVHVHIACPGAGPGADYTTMSPAAPHGLMYAHVLDMSLSATECGSDCFTAWASDIAEDGFSYTTRHPATDPTNGDNWATQFNVCRCEETYYGGCLSTDLKGNQIVTVHTTVSGSFYMWCDGFGPVASSSLAPDGMGGEVATFDLTAFGIGITAECHTFYFSMFPVNPAPANSVVICPCNEDGSEPATKIQYQNGCMVMNMAGDEIIQIETNNNVSPNYAWYGTTGPIHQTGIAPNPAYVPLGTSGALPYIASFNLSMFGPGFAIPYGPCYTFFFSNTTTSPDPLGAFSICSCEAKPGNPKTAAITGSLNITPNPSNGTFTINGALPRAGTTKQATIEVVDILGRTVFSCTADIMNGGINKQISLDNKIVNGVYTVRVKNQEVNEVIRMLIQK